MPQRKRSAWTAPATRAASGPVIAALLGLCPLGPLASPAGASSASSHSDSLAQARRDLLVLSDMPAGWTSSKSSNNGESNVGNKQLARCLGVATSLISENPPSVNSPQFQDKTGDLMVNDNVTVFPSANNAAAEYALGANPRMPGCLTSLASGPLKAKLFGKTPKGTTFGTPLASAVDPSAVGPGVVGFAMSVPITSRGVTINVTVTQLETVKGRLGHQVTFTSVGAPFSIPLEQHLMAVAAGRL